MDVTTMTLSFPTIFLPIFFNVLCVLAALSWPTRDSGYLTGITNLFLLIPALAASLIAWIIWGVTR